MTDWSNIFAEAIPYEEFLSRYASATQRARWDAVYGSFTLIAKQQSLLNTFVRRMPVLCLAAAWCGDCVNQCPIFAHFAESSPKIDLRFIDRDLSPDVRDSLTINGGQRIPVVVFLSEDWFEVSHYGERTISFYRQLAFEQFGPTCPTGLMPPSAELLAAIATEWLTEFERAQLILRLSSRLRKIYGD